jgi:glycosyltransferase involved in cell wall biosynthesis
VDETRLQVVPTAPFDGIAGYVRHVPTLVRRNWPVIRAAVEGVDLVWIKAPASNALLALTAARRAKRPYFTWVAGSARAVVGGQRRSGPAGLLAAVGAAVYDGVTRILERTGPSIRLDGEHFTSLVTEGEIATSRQRWATGMARTAAAGAQNGAIRLAWAGRVVTDKGLDDLFAAVVRLRAEGLPATLDLLGDGPDRLALEQRAAELGLTRALRWRGHLTDRPTYMDRLRDADLFVLPSRAEGVPKVLVEAMAAGLPVVATRVGGVPALMQSGSPGRLVDPSEPDQLAAAIAELARDPSERTRLRDAGLAYAAEHTLDAQAAALVRWMRATFPRLPWPAPPGDRR